MIKALIDQMESPLVVVSTLLEEDREAVIDFLLRLNAPLYLEAISGIREDPKLQHLRIYRPERILQQKRPAVLRIGGVPTFRLWRDLEDMEGKADVLSISHLPFTGLSWGKVIDIEEIYSSQSFKTFEMTNWPDEDRLYRMQLIDLLMRETRSEPGLLYALSDLIPPNATLYLGNSLPIREWDLAAGLRRFEIFASRGLNGIDGQISTFLGLCKPEIENWAIIGDLTAIYDLAAPWIIPQLGVKDLAIVVINNGGGKIFERMFPSKSFQNCHDLSFESLAKFWKLDYERWDSIPKMYRLRRPTLIEVVPDPVATERFWKECSL